MPHVFTYGSLMFEPVWTSLVKGSYKNESASLANYVRRAVISEDYPVVFPQAGASGVTGIIYFDVLVSDVIRLDDFEGDFYERLQEEVLVAQRGAVLAEVYVLKDRYRAIAAASEWDPAFFKAKVIRRFMKNYPGFQRLD